MITDQNLDVRMLHPNLRAAPVLALPAGYAMRHFRADADAVDADVWVDIHKRSDHYLQYASEVFYKSLGHDAQRHGERILFLVDPQGRDIGTISAWNDDELTGQDIGRIHWVAIVPEAQGLGLGRGMLSAACQHLLALGFPTAYLWTSTGRIPALNLYRRFGFEPYHHNAESQQIWRELSPLLKYPVDGNA